MNDSKGWHYRGYLPHYDGGERRWQFVTIHLKDSLAQNVLREWKQELKIYEIRDDEKQKQLRIRIERYLDAGFGQCYFRQAALAKLMQNVLLHFHKVRYNLAAWVIMPNHVHFLLKPVESFAFSTIIHSIKTYAAKQANEILGRSGQFWQEDYFDRYIQDREHFDKTVRYIENNPVKANLCEFPQDWLYGSARFRN